jgi:hypothetical protein
VEQLLLLCAPRFVTASGSLQCVLMPRGSECKYFVPHHVLYMAGLTRGVAALRFYPKHRVSDAPYVPWARVTSPLGRLYAFHARGLAEESGLPDCLALPRVRDVCVLRCSGCSEHDAVWSVQRQLTPEMDAGLARNVHLRSVFLPASAVRFPCGLRLGLFLIIDRGVNRQWPPWLAWEQHPVWSRSAALYAFRFG